MQLARGFAVELAAQNIRVNAVAPGVVDTPLTEPIKKNTDWYSAYANRSALKRWARPEELAWPIVFLASEASSYITGTVLFVDGGWTAIDGRYEPPLEARRCGFRIDRGKKEAAVIRAVDAIADESIAFLQALIQIPTVNPPGEEYRAAAELIGEKLKEFGYQVQYVPAEGRPEHSWEHPRINVIGSMKGETARPLLHFNGHFDVVPVGQGWTVAPFAGVVRNGRLYGRGTADQKAGIAASIFAVEAIRRSGVKLAGTVEQSGTVDEESGGFAGVAYLAEHGWISKDKTDFVIITEPSNVDRVCIGHRGVYWFKVVQHGRIGHGSMPYLGINAADHLGDVLHAVNHSLKPELAKRKTEMPVEPPGSRYASININSVFGGQPEEGTQTPCVIDRAGAIFDRRFLSRRTL